MIQYWFFVAYRFTCLVSTLRGGLRGFTCAWRRCSASQWNAIPRCRALPCTRKTTHSTPSNYGL